MSGEDPGLWAAIASGFGVTLTALGTWAWNHTHRRIDRVATITVPRDEFRLHSEQDERMFIQVSNEISLQRQHITKIFEQMRDMEHQGHERHVELLNAIHQRNSGRQP